jgi:opacity protein-like surface antigen
MKSNLLLSSASRVGFVVMALLGLALSDAVAGGKVGIYGIRMVPRGDDAKNFSRAGYGGGIHVVVPAPQTLSLFAGVAGFEIINLLSETTTFRDQVTGLRVEQQTSQNYSRLFLGAQIGGHGKGFIRPHAGLNVAFVFYGINTDAVIPDDRDRENEIRQKLHGENHTVFGYDLTLGVDLNFWNKWNLDGGVKYLKSFALPQQLGAGSEKVHPEYFQIYLGVGISFRTIRETSE